MSQAIEFLIVASAAFIVVLLAVALAVASVVILAGGAFVWAYAIAAAHRARLHNLQASSTEKSLRETNEAVDEAKARFGLKAPRAPTEQELLEMIMAERTSENGYAEHTTLGNEGYEETSPTSVGGEGDMYAS